MPVSPCANQVTCPDCYDPPVLNLSAEAEDRNQYIGINVIFPWEPPIGWWSQGCKTWVFSAESQEVADALARDQEVHCFVCDPPCNPPPPPCQNNPDCPPPPPGTDPGVPPPPPPTGGGPFNSAAQTCTLPCPDGLDFTHTLPAGGVTSPTSQANANTLAQSLCLQQAQDLLICFTSEPPNGCNNELYFWQAAATGGVGPYTFALPEGAALPAGFTITPSGELTGTPTASGIKVFDLVVTDSQGRTNQRSFAFFIGEITTATPLADGTVGSPYSVTLVSAGAPAGALWAVVAGALPSGVSLSSTTGVISGTPTTSGTFNFTIGLILP